MNRLSFEEYEHLSTDGGLVPVYREIPGDLLTPVSAFLALSAGADSAFLFESVVGGERLGRYSFLGRGPVAGLSVTDGAERADLLSGLRDGLGRKAREVPVLPRFTGGAVGYLA